MLLGSNLFRRTIFEAGAGGETVSLPVASVLAIVTTTLGAGVHPGGLSCRNHMAAWRINVAVRTWTEMNNNGDVSTNAKYYKYRRTKQTRVDSVAHTLIPVDKWSNIIITLCEWCSGNTEDTSPVDPLRFICFIFFLFVFNLTHRPCIQGSRSRAGRRGWHMEEGHNQQLDSERCHRCHKYTVRILMAEKADTHTHTEGEGGLASQKGAPFTSESLLDTYINTWTIIHWVRKSSEIDVEANIHNTQA